MESDTLYYETQLEEILSRKAGEYEAPWLSYFQVQTRKAIMTFFEFEPDGAINPENTNYLHPNALNIFAGAGVPEFPGYGFSDFSRGASAVGAIMSGQEADRASDLVKMQLETMTQRIQSDVPPYPPVLEGLLPLYTSCVSLVLLDEETTGWQALLGYSLGFVWMMGFVELPPANQLEMADVLYQQVKRGTYL